jgi:hypothetical protein
MEKVYLINSDGDKRETTLTAWEQDKERARLKANGYRLDRERHESERKAGQPVNESAPENVNEAKPKTKK